QIKLSVVASDSFGVSGRAMGAALVAGARDPKVLAQLARARMRAKLSLLEEAFTGFFTDQHAFLLAKMLGRVDALDADLAQLDAKLQELIAPFARAVDRLDEIPGVGQTAAQLLIAEIGADMTRFPTAGHLVSWAKFAPGVKESAGKPKGRGSTGHGNPYLARVLGEVAVAASKTKTFLGERYRRIARRRGKKRAIVAVGRSSWSSPGTCCPTQRPTSTTSAPASTTPPSAPNAPSATTSASWRPSATRSPSNPPPDRPSPGNQHHANRIRTEPGCCRVPAHRGFSDQSRYPGGTPRRCENGPGCPPTPMHPWSFEAVIQSGAGARQQGRALLP
ncbi:MAG TPA: transposase, partial [Actinomycetota bacterium]|nr:transposase [Actinomycetota bacterium]